MEGGEDERGIFARERTRMGTDPNAGFLHRGHGERGGGRRVESTRKIRSRIGSLPAHHSRRFAAFAAFAGKIWFVNPSIIYSLSESDSCQFVCIRG